MGIHRTGENVTREKDEAGWDWLKLGLAEPDSGGNAIVFKLLCAPLSVGLDVLKSYYMAIWVYCAHRNV
jgi:hypothetical protein